jgi:hypothetical protein
LAIFEQPAVNDSFSKLFALLLRNEFKNGMGQIPQKEGKKGYFMFRAGGDATEILDPQCNWRVKSVFVAAEISQ